MGGIVGHVVQRPWVIEHRPSDTVESVVGGAYEEKVVHNRIDGDRLAEGPHNCRGVVASQERC